MEGLGEEVEEVGGVVVADDLEGGGDVGDGGGVDADVGGDGADGGEGVAAELLVGEGERFDVAGGKEVSPEGFTAEDFVVELEGAGRGEAEGWGRTGACGADPPAAVVGAVPTDRLLVFVFPREPDAGGTGEEFQKRLQLVVGAFDRKDAVGRGAAAQQAGEIFFQRSREGEAIARAAVGPVQ